MARIGVLALQGDFREHINVLRQLGADTEEVRLPQHLMRLDGLILPGGESTTVRKLLSQYDLMDAIRGLADEGLQERLREVGREVTRFSFLHHSEQAKQFLEQWESALDNPGGDLG